jgi:hypothetical protein
VKIIRIAFAAAAIAALPAIAGTGSDLPIDLDRPGALDQVKRERPQQVEAISQVLRVAERLPCKEGELKTLQVRFDVRDLACTMVLMTSYPPKRKVTFALGAERYVAVVTMKDTAGRIVPAKEVR